MTQEPDWFKSAVFYEVLVRSFADADHNGVGDLAGLTSKLDYLAWLGIDCLWLPPFFPSPLRDPFGDRVYPPDQVARLKLIKQLLSEGWRAGAVVPLSDTALHSMLGLAVDAPTPLPQVASTGLLLMSSFIPKTLPGTIL